jgi:hypothetical protein
MKFTNKKSIVLVIAILVVGCKAPSIVESSSSTVVPDAFGTTTDTVNTANVQWRSFFRDKNCRH